MLQEIDNQVFELTFNEIKNLVINSRKKIIQLLIQKC